MASISGFEIIERLHASSNSIVYRARHIEDGRPAILKMLEEAYPSPERIAWFRREYEVTKSLAGVPGVIGVRALHSEQNRWIMELEDFGGASLSRALAERALDPAEVGEIAISIARTLGGLHERGVIHRDVNPSNLIYHRESRTLKLIDFGIASLLSREDAGLRAPSKMEGTLAYIAPEQTGRMNRAVDDRADFYSLGATLYELVTGQPPFPAGDPLELVHAHIARRPVPPAEKAPAAGEALSAVVMKLLEKNAEDRYQSATGLLHDLEEVQRRRAAGSSELFELGVGDVSGRLQIPEKLYGREQETEALLGAFERVAAGASEITLVAGYSGIGKSVLIRQIYRPITARRGYFISGKFDQLQRDIPYAPLVQAFRGMVLQLLSESAAKIAVWQKDILHALGPNGGVLTEVIPELSALLGAQPPPPALDPKEQQNRFRSVFQAFVHVLARREHPLVLFLDDLQWVDSASLDLCEALMTGGEAGHLLLVGAYRDNEVPDVHPLAMRIEKLRRSGVSIQQIALAPLSREHVTELAEDTFGRGAPGISDLAALVHAKTGGNPFFVREFLKHLHAEKQVVFDPASASWRFDLGQIHARGVTDNVVELLAGQVQKLAAPAQKALMFAACIGGTFDLRSLAIVAEKAPRDAAADLWEAVSAGLLTTVGESYKLTGIDVEGLLETVPVVYRFAHDRVQQAAYSCFPDDERRRVHYRIGKLLLSTIASDELEHRIFDVVGQLDHGIELAVERAERDDLARLHLVAGRKAKASAAYGPALTYLHVGIGLLGEPGADPRAADPTEGFRRQYRLSLDLFDEAAEAACLIGQYDEVSRLVQITRAHATSVLDRVRSYKAEIQSHAARDQLQDGVRAGLAALAHLGVEIPESPGFDFIGQVGGQAAQTWMGKDIDALASLPEMTDETKLAAMEIMARLYIPAFNGAPGVFALIVFHEVMLSLQHGVTQRSARGFVAYGFILCTLGYIEPGYHFGKLALALCDRFGGAEKASTVFMFNLFVRHWKDPLKDTVEPFFQAYQLALDTGDLEFAALSLLGPVLQSFWAGTELPALAKRASEHSRAIQRLRQELPQESHDLHYQATLNLLGESADPCILTGKAIDEEQKVRHYTATHNITLLALFHLNKLTLHFLFGHVGQALSHAMEVEKNAAGITPFMGTGVFHFYDALAHLADPPAGGEARDGALARADLDLGKLRDWAKHAPDNFEHKALLVEAERARVAGDASLARELYDRAIAQAHEHGFLQEEALAYELCARFHAAAGRAHLARIYLREARYSYERWGALAKVRDLEERFPDVLGRAQGPAPLAGRASTITTTTTTQRGGGALDLLSVLKASQVLSGEIALDKLLAKLLHTVLENAGAHRACLLLETHGELVIEAEGQAFGPPPRVLESVPLASGDRLPVSMVLRVARTGAAEVTSDASQEALLAEDPYVKRTGLKSALCMPLVHQGKTAAILYLENPLVKDAFTHDRLELLNLLSAEMAIAIENARLYLKLDAANRELSAYSQTLEERVAQRTEELFDKNKELEKTLAQLRDAQEQLVMREKMASLGALTAGIAHEIRNPFNFINNFAQLSRELTADLKAEMDAWIETKDDSHKADIEGLMEDLSQNAGAIEQHGRRVNGILNSMLVHTAGADEERSLIDLNEIVGQSAYLAHAATRARHGAPEVRIESSYDAGLPPIEAAPELGRAFINMVENACYATMQKAKQVGAGFQPVIRLSTADRDGRVEVRIHDNGVGIAAENLDKIFNPFFTTKPPGDGTGLGLSICYDIVVRKHGGALRVESKEGEYAEFILSLPKKSAAAPT